MDREEFERSLADLQRRQRRWDRAYQLAGAALSLLIAGAVLAVGIYREWLIWRR